MVKERDRERIMVAVNSRS